MDHRDLRDGVQDLTTTAVIAVTAMAAMGTSVSVEANSPIAASPASIAAT